MTIHIYQPTLFCLIYIGCQCLSDSIENQLEACLQYTYTYKVLTAGQFDYVAAVQTDILKPNSGNLLKTYHKGRNPLGELVGNYTVSQKTKQNYFCYNYVKLPPDLAIFGTKMANSL